VIRDVVRTCSLALDSRAGSRASLSSLSGGHLNASISVALAFILPIHCCDPASLHLAVDWGFRLPQGSLFKNPLPLPGGQESTYILLIIIQWGLAS
jgi:hypothetical protein